MSHDDEIRAALEWLRDRDKSRPGPLCPGCARRTLETRPEIRDGLCWNCLDVREGIG